MTGKRMPGILLSFVLFAAFQLSAQNGKITLDSLYPNHVYKINSIMGMQWKPDGSTYTFLKVNRQLRAVEIYQHDCVTGAETPLVEADALKPEGEKQPVAFSNYEISPDGTHLLLTGVLLARSVKSGGTFYLFDLGTKKIVKTFESEQEQDNISFSPDGKKIGFVRGNNIFVYDIPSEKLIQLTKDGSEDILNGSFDWVYEEEFSIIRAYEWAPDSKAIAFWRLDQSPEPVIELARYDSLYLNPLKQRYPKAGAKNALVKIGVANTETGSTTWVDLGTETDIYIPRIKFTANPAVLSVQRLDRLQHKLDFLFADCSTGKTRTVFTETDTCWIDIFDDLTFLKNGKQFIWSSERDGFKHLYLYNIDGTLVSQITSGNWEVDKLEAVNEAEGKLYYSSNERGTRYRDIYAISLNGKDKVLLTEAKGTHKASFSPSRSFYTDTYSSVDMPPAITVYSTKTGKVAELTTADVSYNKVYAMGKSEFLTFTTSDGVSLNAYMIKPPDFDPAKKYPVLFYNYSGPGSQTVKDEFGGGNYFWYQMLAQHGYIIFMLDNRGTGGRGTAFKHLVYKKLGTWEPNDLIEGAKFMAAQPYVDASRIGIWGWSYGGYMTALTLMKGADYFKVGIAVAPVTSWRFYDDIYTERYMSLPSLNEAGYESSAVLNYTQKLKGKLLLVHGTADDNVHFQNSVKLADKLISENRQFTTMFYPEKNHSIYGGKTRQHLYTMMTNFIFQNL
jgi:dipeptidyl-peptidase-4